MSFRKFGGLNYAKSNNIVHNHISNTDVLGITDHIGATGSQITCESELIVLDDITSENLTVNNRIRTEYISGPTGVGELGVLKLDSELQTSRNIVFEPRTAFEPQVALIFSDGTSQYTSITSTSSYWQPIGDVNSPSAIFYTRRVIIGTNPTSVSLASEVNLAVNGTVGVLGDLYVGKIVGATFQPQFFVTDNGNMGVTGASNFYNDVTIAGPNVVVNPSNGNMRLKNTINIDSSRVAVGTNAGQTGQNEGSIAFGTNAGQTEQGKTGTQSYGGNSVAIGANAGQTGQWSRSVAIGFNAGADNQQNNSIAIGNAAGYTAQKSYSVAIGDLAGQYGQQNSSVAVGTNAGQNQQGTVGGDAVAGDAVAIGIDAGRTSQQFAATAIGRRAGNNGQRDYAVAIGNEAGWTAQATRGIAIGDGAGRSNQGAFSIAIGAYAGRTNQPNHSTIINSSGSILDPVNSNALYVNPIRSTTDATALPMIYNTSTKEIIACNGALTIPGALTLTTGFGSSSTNSLTIRDSSSSNQIGFLPNSGPGFYNAIVSSGDQVIYAANSTSSLNLEALTLTTHSSTSCGLRISSNAILLGAGETSTTPSTRMDINGANNTLTLSTSNTTALSINSSGISTFSRNVVITNGNNLQLYGPGTSGTSPVLVMFSDGPTQKNYIQSGLNYTSNSQTDLVFSSIFNVTNYATMNANGVTSKSFNATSDYRIKENIQQITANIDALNPVQYYNTLSKRQDFGLIAHEVQEHFPTLVYGEKDGPENQSINYTGLIAILISEIQELKKKVNELMNKEK
jgi:hypothetical protein